MHGDHSYNGFYIAVGMNELNLFYYHGSLRSNMLNKEDMLENYQVICNLGRLYLFSLFLLSLLFSIHFLILLSQPLCLKQ